MKSSLTQASHSSGSSPLNPFYDDIGELTDLPPIFRDQIEHFFRHYKDLERGKWDPAETLPFALGEIVEL